MQYLTCIKNPICTKNSLVGRIFEELLSGGSMPNKKRN